MINILVLEDDIKLNQIICMKLNAHGYNSISCLNVPDAFNAFQKCTIDFIISDIMLPQIDGFEFVSLIRANNPLIPIIFMTAKNDFASKEKGYRLGIDDYMVKPVDPDEMLLRVGALLRRAKIMSEKKLTIGNLSMDADELSTYYNGEEISLTLKEFQILFKLLSYPRKTFTRGQLMDEFWGVDSSSIYRTLDVHISRIREKLAHASEFEIVTIRGIGYKAIIKE